LVIGINHNKEFNSMSTKQLSEIFIRDPFIVTMPEQGGYYLYGTNFNMSNNIGFDTYFSKNLHDWEGPFEVFRPPAGFWAHTQFWAPEVTRVEDKFIMLASFTGNIRGTQVLTATSPRGPFIPQGNKPITPNDRRSLDGTLFIDAEKTPWMVYADCWHTNKCNGTIRKLRLNTDLSPSNDAPSIILSSKEAPWNAELTDIGPGIYCGEGPFVWQSESGQLYLMWSGFAAGMVYKVGVARSLSGTMEGPWQQQPKPLWNGDGGHNMIFKTLEGKSIVSLHSPGYVPNAQPERTRLFLLNETSDGILSCGDEYL
jgi:arabinan endo-1,5-alpha-L-arabinosidase